MHVVSLAVFETCDFFLIFLLVCRLSRTIRTHGADSSNVTCRRSRKRNFPSFIDSSCDDEFLSDLPQHADDDLVGNDLWVKFELPDTPPLSPQRPSLIVDPLLDHDVGVPSSGSASEKSEPAESLSSASSSPESSEGEEDSDDSRLNTESAEHVLKDLMWCASRVTMNGLASAHPQGRLLPNSVALAAKGASRAPVSSAVQSPAEESDRAAPFPFPLNAHGTAFTPERRLSVDLTGRPLFIIIFFLHLFKIKISNLSLQSV